MSHTIRVIPRLDIKGPNLIKGIQMDGHRVLATAEEFFGKSWIFTEASPMPGNMKMEWKLKYIVS